MHILVTGGTGFIGNHLCRALIAQGHHVMCIDNHSTGYLENIRDLLSHPNFQFFEHDVIHPFHAKNMDQIYHLACPASPKAYQSDSIKTIQTNVLGTMHLLGLAKTTGARILFTSTSEIYGDAKVHPQPEEYWGNVNPIGIRSCYDEGKRMAETLCMEYHRNHQVDIRIARIFNTYGPRMHPDDGRVVSNFIVQALLNQPITLYGDGSQIRSFCFVADTVSGLMALMNQTATIGPVNIGNPEEMTVSVLANHILRLLPESQSILTYVDLPQDDPVQRRPDITKAMTYLGWQPTVSLEEGLQTTIDWFRRAKTDAHASLSSILGAK